MNTDKSDKNKLIPLLGFLALVVGIAVLASFATHHSLEPWYRELKKPAWTPPSWVFPIVWPILYTLIALAGWHLYLAEKSSKRTLALTFYFLQLVLNALWSFVFFYFKNPYGGLIILFLLAALISRTVRTAWPVSERASLLLLPYLAWVLFAISLNAAIVWMN